ncbi:MAG: hypothetical protein LCH54_02835 [Bacteroidetes bacterium]|nr:hypothetical protein [Bacteroidota bacterium]
MKPIVFSLCLILAGFSPGFSQVAGTFYSSGDANEIYGPVLKSYEIEPLVLQQIVSLAEKEGNRIWFFYDENGSSFIISGRAKTVLFTTGNSTFDGKLGRVFDVIKVQTLLNKHPGKLVNLQLRQNGVFSLETDGEVLERGLMCPPFCE